MKSKENDRNAIGQRIKKIRKALGFTQEKMVSFFKIGRANYSRIEKGDVGVNTDIIEALMDNFNVDPTWLIKGTGRMFVRDKARDDIMGDLDFGQHTEEIKQFLKDMYEYPMLLHAMLSRYYEYMATHQDILKKSRDENESGNLPEAGNGGE